MPDSTPLPTVTRVAVYHANTDIDVETRPLSPPGPGELVMRVHASGICGSDIMEWYRKPRAPAVLGHEVAGSIIALGEGVDHLELGDRIVATHHVPCLDCRFCRTGRETMCEMLRKTNFDPGGFSEFIRVPAANVERGVLEVPEHVSDDAASMVEPLACVIRGQRKAAVGPVDTVLIEGAGVSGCLHFLAARAAGAARVYMSDVRASRRKLAKDLGADRVFDATEPIAAEIRAELGHGVDCVILCTGAMPAIQQALEAVDRGGTVFFFAPMGPGETFPLPFNDVFWRNDITLTSSYGAGPGDMALAMDLIAGRLGDIADLVTHRIPLSDVQRGFELMIKGEDSLKIIVDPRLDH